MAPLRTCFTYLSVRCYQLVNYKTVTILTFITGFLNISGWLVQRCNWLHVLSFVFCICRMNQNWEGSGNAGAESADDVWGVLSPEGQTEVQTDWETFVIGESLLWLKSNSIFTPKTRIKGFLHFTLSKSHAHHSIHISRNIINIIFMIIQTWSQN